MGIFPDSFERLIAIKIKTPYTVNTAKGERIIKTLREIERTIVLGSRYTSIMAVFGSLVSSMLMFFLGLCDIYLAFMQGISLPKEATETSPNTLTVIKVIEGLDRFLIAIVLLYFAYGVYSLFIRPDKGTKEKRDDLALPSWLTVKEIGQLKQVVAEVIIVIIFVLFLRVALQAFQAANLILSWQQIATLLVLPICATFLALALKLVELHPKKPQHPEE